MCASVIEQDFKRTKLIDRKRAPRYRLFYHLTRMVPTKGCLGQDNRAGAVAYDVDHMARDTNIATFDHKAREFDKAPEQFVKHATSHGTTSEGTWDRRERRH